MRLPALQLRDVPVLVRTIWLLAGITVLQNVLPVPALIRRLDSRRRTGATSQSSMDVDRLVRLTRGLLRRIYGSRFCMQHALVLFHFLRRSGYPARIYVGMVRRDGKLDGHAWLVVNGRTPAETRDPSQVYRMTYSYPEVDPSHFRLPGRQDQVPAESDQRVAEPGIPQHESRHQTLSVPTHSTTNQ